jgi:hypothetical protein
MPAYDLLERRSRSVGYGSASCSGGRHSTRCRRALGTLVPVADPVELHAAIEAVGAEGGLDLQALRTAARQADRSVSDLRTSLNRYTTDAAVDTDGVCVIIGGSLARREVTHGADCDYLVLVTGTPDHSVIPKFMRWMELLRDKFALMPPGSQRIFADAATSSELMARIGLDADSNVNTTRRLLALIESDWLFDQEARKLIVRRLLERYCADYCPDSDFWVQHTVRIPHFLLNDVIRFWRTMAVDFGAKQWSALRPDWGLRYAKLLTTRKVLFAGTLSTIFRTQAALEGITDNGERYASLLDYLEEEFSVPPLERLMRSYDRVVDSESKESLVQILASYDEFIDILERPGVRSIFQYGDKDDPDTARYRDAAQEGAAQIHERLNQLFFDDPLFQDLTRHYGLF